MEKNVGLVFDSELQKKQNNDNNEPMNLLECFHYFCSIGDLEKVKEIFMCLKTRQIPEKYREDSDHILQYKLEDLCLGDAWGSTPLHKSAANGHTEVCEFLINNLRAKCVPNENLNTPLHWAVLNNQVEVVQLLCNSFNA